MYQNIIHKERTFAFLQNAKMVILVAGLLAWSVASAQSQRDCSQESQAFGRYLDGRSMCEQKNPTSLHDILEGVRCHIINETRFAETTCVSAMRASKKVVLFLLNQELSNLEDARTERRPLPEIFAQSKKHWALIREENSEGAKLGTEEFTRISQREADHRAAQRIERSLSILGGLPTPSSSPKTRQYLLYGRLIVCTEQGSVTTCI